MDKAPLRVLIYFMLQASLNWVYVLLVKYHFGMLVNAWFALVPLIGFFYITFFLIASVGLYKQKQLGFNLGLGVLLFGAVCVAISYMLVYKLHYLFDVTIAPLLLVNLCIAVYMGKNRDYFQED